MKKIILLALSLWLSMSGIAQGMRNSKEMQEKYRSQKIAFITDKMALTPEEAKVFWPLYKKLEDEKDALVNELQEFRSQFPEQEIDMTEQQAKEYLMFLNKHHSAMNKLIQEYQAKYLKVISAKKLLLLNDAENEFRRHLLREFRGGRGMNQRFPE
ncbi:MAG: hypothetical protein JW729_06655 [Bacteroidales bacterium]|nr:hypothetical protein [Bacteroidales bacterium]